MGALLPMKIPPLLLLLAEIPESVKVLPELFNTAMAPSPPPLPLSPLAIDKVPTLVSSGLPCEPTPVKALMVNVPEVVMSAPPEVPI